MLNLELQNPFLKKGRKGILFSFFMFFSLQIQIIFQTCNLQSLAEDAMCGEIWIKKYRVLQQASDKKSQNLTKDEKIHERTFLDQGRTGQHFFGFRVGSGLDVRVSGRVGFFIKNHIGFRVLHFGFRVMIRVENLESDLWNFKIIFQQSDVYRNFSSEKYFQSNFDKNSSKKVEIFDFCAIFY